MRTSFAQIFVLEVVVVESARVGLIGSCCLLLAEELGLANGWNAGLVVLLVELRKEVFTVSRWNYLADCWLLG